jgi:hypothetical protein
MGFARDEVFLQLVDMWTKRPIEVGGTYNVLQAGVPAEQTIYSSENSSSAASNPGSISSDGIIRFWVASGTSSIDISIYTANGDAEFIQGIVPSLQSNSGQNHVDINPHRRDQILVIPMIFNDNTETDTGFTLVGPVVISDIELFVTTVDAGETLDIGLDGTTTNDPNGLVAAASVATAGYVELGGAVNNGSNIDYYDSIVYGALLASFINGSDAVATNGGITRIKAYIAEAETDANITYTESAGGDAFAGYMMVHLLRMPT